MERILSKHTASISELKKNPTALLREADGEPIAILNHNRPTAYLIPAETYAEMVEALEDIASMSVVRERLDEGASSVDVDINEL